MKLRFIGQDGSMGLKHGEVYNVLISGKDRLVLSWYPFKTSCPYGSLAALCRNWEDVK